MEFSVKSKSMLDAMKLAASVTQGPEHINIECDKKNLYILATGNHNSIRVNVEADVQKKGRATVNSYTLTNILKGRSSLTFVLHDNEMKFNSSRYKGSFVVPPYEEIAISPEEDSLEFKMESKLQTKLLDVIRSVYLSNVYTEIPMYLFMKLNKNGIKACCCDNTHIAFYRNKNLASKKEKSISLPIKTFDQIATLAKGLPYKIAVSDSSLYVSSEVFDLSMPMIQSDDALNLEATESFVKGLPKKGNIRFTLPRTQLISILNNCSAIYEENAGLEFKKTKKNSVVLQLRTSFGQVEEKTKAKDVHWKGESVKCDPKLLLDTVQTIPQSVKDVELNIVDDRALFFNVKHNKAKICYSCTVL